MLCPHYILLMNASFLCMRWLTQDSWSLSLCWVATFMWTAVPISWSRVEYTQQLLAGKCITPAWICISFSGKQNTTGGGMVTPSELVLFRSLTLTVLQHYVALYVCSVPLATGRLKISCTVHFVRCIWFQETDFSWDSGIMFCNTNVIDSMTLQNDQAVFLAYHVSSSFSEQSLLGKYMPEVLTFSPLMWVRYCTLCFSAWWQPLKLTQEQVQLLQRTSLLYNHVWPLSFFIFAQKIVVYLFIWLRIVFLICCVFSKKCIVHGLQYFICRMWWLFAVTYTFTLSMYVVLIAFWNIYILF
jgi:hypothetical protein